MEESPTKYYIRIKGEQRGPFPLDQLPQEGVRPSTYVWCDGMDNWEKAEDVAEICRLFRNRIHTLMHPGSVIAEQQRRAEADIPLKASAESSPSRYDHHLPEGEQLPSIEEIEAREDHSHPPTPMIAAAIVGLILLPPAGAVGLFYALKSRKMWRKGEKDNAHELTRSAKMWSGIAFFLGMILLAFIFRFFL